MIVIFKATVDDFIFLKTPGTMAISALFPTKGGPLSAFLRSNSIGTDKTVFLTIADRNFIEAAIHFKTQLDKFELGETCVILCLDTDCLEAAKAQSVLAYDGYVIREAGDWRMPVAQMKVQSPFSQINVINVLLVCR